MYVFRLMMSVDKPQIFLDTSNNASYHAFVYLASLHVSSSPSTMLIPSPVHSIFACSNTYSISSLSAFSFWTSQTPTLTLVWLKTLCYLHFFAFLEMISLEGIRKSLFFTLVPIQRDIWRIFNTTKCHLCKRTAGSLIDRIIIKEFHKISLGDLWFLFKPINSFKERDTNFRDTEWRGQHAFVHTERHWRSEES